VRNLKIRILLLVFIVFFAACNSPEEKREKNISEILNKLQGKKFTFPDSVQVIYKDSLYGAEKLKPLLKKKYKITAKIYGDCHVCVESLKKWEEQIINKCDTGRVAFLFYIYVTKLYSFRADLYQKITLDYPLILDSADYYIRNNNLENYDERFQDFMLDKENRIKIIGNPLDNPQLAELYLNELTK